MAREFRKNIAVLIGIDDYQNGIPKLGTARRDAETLARCLEEDHGYEVTLLLDEGAELADLTTVLRDVLPMELEEDDRFLLYFAGHGIAQDGDDGPEGFLIPQDARPEDRDTLLPMTMVADAIGALPCHHMLLVFDCCFAGSFRWTSTRSFLPTHQTLYRKRYERFLDFPAAQVLTSAAQDEKALDVIDGLTIGERDTPEGHSPFATALLNGLRGDADRPGPDGQPDGVITATELYLYVRDVVELAAEDRGTRQTPGLWPLARHDRGEFLFHTPHAELVIKEDPPLDYANNPWRGLRSYTDAHQDLFFGRTRVVEELQALLRRDLELIAVVGASGSGKSSVVNAGLLPHLDGVVGPLRPGGRPLAMLQEARERLDATPDARFLVIDQYEEIFTMTTDPQVRTQFAEDLVALAGAAAVRVILTMRADFEPQVRQSPLGSHVDAGRYAIPPMTREEMREVIDGPAAARVLYFEPPSLPDRILDDLAAMPGALPLLSFTLSELYRRYLEQEERSDRALREEDYDAVGGVVGSLQTRATELLEASTDDEQITMRNLMLRMVSDEGGELAKRRLVQREQQWKDGDETDRVQDVLGRLIEARLLVTGVTDADGEAYVEPAHDMLVLTWDRIRQWQGELDEPLKLRRALWQAATDWQDDDRPKARLWHDDVRLPQLAAAIDAPSHWMNGLESAFVARSAAHKERRRLVFNVVAMVIVGILLGITIYAVGQQRQAVAKGKEALDNMELAEERTRQAEAAMATAEANREKAEKNAEDARFNLALAEKNEAEAKKNAQEAEDNLELARQKEQEALDSMRIAQDAREDSERNLAKALAGQARALTRLRGRGNDALLAAVRASSKHEHLVQERDSATAVLSEVINRVKGPTLGDGTVSAVALLAGDRHPTVVTGDLQGRVIAYGDPRWVHRDPARAHSAAVTAIASNRELVATGDASGLVRLWRPAETASETGLDPVRAIDLKERGGIGEMLMQPDGTLVVTTSDGSVIVVDEEKRRRIKATPRPPRALAVSASGAIAIGTDDGQLLVYGADPSPTVVDAHRGWVTTLAWAGETLVSAGEDGTIRIDDGATVKRLENHEGPVQDVAIHHTGRLLASASWDGTIRIWDLVEGTQLDVQPGHGAWVWSVRWGPGDLVLSAGEDGTARVWAWDHAARKTRVLDLLEGHDGHVRHARFSGRGDHVVTLGGDGHARLWRIGKSQQDDASDDGSTATELGDDLVRVRGGGSTIAVVNGRSTAFVWNGQARSPASVALATSVAVTQDHDAVFGNSIGQVIRVRGDGEQAARIELGSVPVTAIATAGPLIAAGAEDGELAVWPQGLSGERIDLEPPPNRTEVLTLAATAQTVLAVGRDKEVRVWRIDGDGFETFRPPTRPLSAVLVADDTALIGLADGAVEAWRRGPEGWAPGTIRRVLDAPVVDMTLSPDGTRLGAVTRDGHAEELDARSLAPLLRHDAVEVVGFFFADSTSATVTRAGEVRRSPAGLEDYRSLVCNWLGRANVLEAKEPCGVSL